MLRQDAFTRQTVQEKMECYQKSEAALQKCIDLDPTDARAYVSLGKLLTQQHRYDEARKVYEDGSAVTGVPQPFRVNIRAISSHSLQTRVDALCSFYKALSVTSLAFAHCKELQAHDER